MLKSIRLKNFKLHEDTSIEAARITVFIGPNNSGKSSIFQALLALREAVQRGTGEFLVPAERQETKKDQPFLYPEFRIIDIGKFDDVARVARRDIEIAVGGVLEQPQDLEQVGPVEIRFEVNVHANVLSCHNGVLRVQRQQLSWSASPPVPQGPVQSSLDVGDFVFMFATSNDFHLIQPAGLRFFSSSRTDVPEVARRMARSLASAPSQLLNSLHPVSPLRGLEEHGQPLPESRYQSVERMTLPDRAVAVAAAIASDVGLKSQVSEALRDLLKIGIDVQHVGAHRVMLRTTTARADKAGGLFANEGMGANQIPFLFVPIAMTPPHETVLLFEPEVHLHPRSQSELTSLLLEAAQKRNLQLMIETHSEHVLHKLLHSVATGELGERDLAVYYFENANGISKTRKLQINKHGQVEGGLPGFFEQSLEELSESLQSFKKT
jgi:energy-coupling factor transporter ATP-binding protein EcfA2